jgi:hypothetical protein
MAKQEAPLGTLDDFLPPGSYQLVAPFLLNYKVHLTITKSRKTVLGDYRNAVLGKAHRITVNGNLNQFAFLITLLHELAHLITYIRYGHRVASHGKEWKQQFGELLKHFLQTDLFPVDIKKQLMLSMNNPAASSCADDALMRILRKYDAIADGICLVEEIEEGALFIASNGRVFKKMKKLRKRIQALEVATGRMYLFSPIYEVKKNDSL